MSAQKPHLKDSQSWQFDGVIWQILVHPSAPVLFVEARNSADKRVSFSAVNVISGHFLWKDHHFDEGWWISLSAVDEQLLFLTMYLSPENPGSKSLLAMDIPSREIRWFKNNFSFLGIHDQVVVGFDTHLSHKTAVRITDGQPVMEQIGGQYDSPSGRVLAPHRYEEGTLHYQTVQRFMNEKFGIDPHQAIEYAEYQGYIVISYYQSRNTLANYLLVLDSDGHVCLEEILGERLEGIAVGSFFIFSGFLIFVKNKRVLVSCKL